MKWEQRPKDEWYLARKEWLKKEVFQAERNYKVKLINWLVSFNPSQSYQVNKCSRKFSERMWCPSVLGAVWGNDLVSKCDTGEGVPRAFLTVFLYFHRGSGLFILLFFPRLGGKWEVVTLWSRTGTLQLRVRCAGFWTQYCHPLSCGPGHIAYPSLN